MIFSLIKSSIITEILDVLENWNDSLNWKNVAVQKNKKYNHPFVLVKKPEDSFSQKINEHFIDSYPEEIKTEKMNFDQIEYLNALFFNCYILIWTFNFDIFLNCTFADNHW